MVLDTSVAIKWVKQLNEVDSDKAYSYYQRLQSGEINVTVPDLMLYEITNYVSRQKGQIYSDCQEFIVGMFESKIEFVRPDKELIESAVTLGHELGVSGYDAIYLAVAKKYNTKLVTADKKLLIAAPDLTVSL